MVDTTELELLRESVKIYKSENENLRVEIAELKMKLQDAIQRTAKNADSREENLWR